MQDSSASGTHFDLPLPRSGLPDYKIREQAFLPSTCLDRDRTGDTAKQKTVGGDSGAATSLSTRRISNETSWEKSLSCSHSFLSRENIFLFRRNS
jgi:hypothetical protein